MRDRILNAVAFVIGTALILTAFYIGCRALKNDPGLWLFATVGVYSPRGAEIFSAPTLSVRVAWDRSPGAVDGYIVHYRKAGFPYASSIDVGNSLSARITGLARKTTYRVMVTSYRGDLESKPSAEISFRTGNNINSPVDQL